MSGSTLVPVTAEKLWQELSELVEGKLRDILAQAGAGQRLRVTTLPEPVMMRVCAGLRDDQRWVARVLSARPGEESICATATKLIELRNTLSEPLLAFIPPGMRTAAEDSLDVATFTELSLEELTEELAGRLRERLAPELRERIDDGLEYLRTEGQLRNADQEVDYLLTVDRNGGDARAAGGALFRLGLVPDFKVFDQANPRHALSRNFNACARLSDPGQPLQVRIARLGLEPKTIQGTLFDYLRQRSAADVPAWAEPIACDPKRHELSFDRWPFEDQADSDELRLIIEPLELAVQKADEITGAAQVPVLNLEAKKPLKITFRSVPKPIRVPRWKHYRIQLFALSGEKPSVAWESNNFKPPTKGRHSKIYRSIKIKDLEELDEGTYFARVEAYDANGGLLTGRYEQTGEAGKRLENESETFLITRSETPVEVPEQRAVNVVSLLDAWVQLAARALGARDLITAVPERAGLTGCWRESPAAAPRGDVHFRFAGEADGWTVVMPALLRKLELTILEKPEELGAYVLDLDAPKLADVTVDRRELPPLPDDPEVREFLAARRAVFEAIAGQHLARAGEGEEENDPMRRSIVETADLLAPAAEIDACADAYRRLAERAAAEPALARGLAQIDTVQLRWKRTGSGDPRSALLAA
ncbi:MAG: hypothetical protein GY856_08375, partial [bacterium]|nr:hypothetical protein [bacterium]